MKLSASLRALLLGAVFVAAPCAHAAIYYWDQNGTTAGFGTAGGTWDAVGSSTWNETAAGDVGPIVSTTTTTTDTINFGTATASSLLAGTITVAGTVDAGNITFGSGSGAIVLSGGIINLAATTSITVNNALDTIDSDLTGAATSLTKLGTGILSLGGSNSYTGSTIVSAGTLRLTNVNALASSSGLSLATGTTLQLRSDTNNATFNTPTITLGSSGATATINVDRLSSGSNNTLVLGGGLNFNSGLFTLNVTGGNGYALSIPTATITNQVAGSGTRAINTGTTNTNFGTLNILMNSSSGDPTLTLSGSSVNSIGTLALSRTAGANRGSVIISSGTWTFGDINGFNGNIGNGFTVNGGTMTITGSFNATGLGGTFTLNNAQLNYNSASAVRSDDADFVFNNAGFKLDNTSGAAITTSTHNPGMQWNADWTFLGSNGANSNLNLGTGSVSMNATRQVTVTNAATTLTVNGIISGSGFGLTKAGAGTLALGGVNIFSGATTVSAGTLTLTNALALQNSALVTTGAGTITLSGHTSPTFGGLSGATGDLATIISNYNTVTGITLNPNSGSVTYGGAIANGSGNTSVTKTGLGTQILSGTNTYSGATTISAGTLSVGVAANLGNAASDLFFDGGTLQITGTTLTSFTDLARTNSITFNSGKTVGLDINNAGNIFTAGQVLNQGTGGLLKAGAGTLVLSQVNTFTGGTNITGGTLQISSAGSLGGGAYAGTLANAGTLQYSSSATQTLSGIISGTGSLIKDTNTSTLTLSAANTFSGTTTVSAGILNLTIATALQNSTLDTTASITGDASNGLRTTVTTLTLGGLTGNKALASVFTTATGGPGNATAVGGYSGVTALTLNPGAGVSNSYTGAIDDGAAAMALNKTGLGTQILGGTNGYTGATSVSNGLLLITGSTSASSAVGVSAGAIGGSGTIGGAVTLSGTGGIDLRNGAVGNLTLSSTLTINGSAGANSLSFDLGSAAASTDKIIVSGAPSVTNNGVVVGFNQIGGSAARINAGIYTIIQGTSAPTLANYALATTKAFGNTYALQVTGNNLEVVTTQVAAAGTTAFWSGAVSGSWLTTSGTAASSNWNTNVGGNVGFGIDVPAYNTNVTFGTTSPVMANLSTTLGADFNINSLTLSPLTGGITIGGAANMLTLESSGTAITSSNTSLTNTISANIGIAASQTWSVATGGTLAVSGAITDFSAGRTLTKTGAGTLTLSGNNTYSGVTAINAGVITISHNNALGTTAGNTTIAAGSGLLRVINSITSPENITITGAGNAINNTSGGSCFLSGNITLDNPTGAITVTTNNGGSSITFSGTITQLGTSRDLTLDTPSSGGQGITVNNSIANNGGRLVIGGSGTKSAVILKGVNATDGTGIGTTLINAGANLTLGVSQALNTTANLTADGTFALAGFDQTVNALIGASTGIVSSATAGTRTLTVGNGDGSGTYSGTIVTGTGVIQLTKTGAGTQILSGANTYTGTTLVSAGTLNLTGARVAASGAINVYGGTLGINNVSFNSSLGANAFFVGTTGANGIVNHQAGSISFSGGNQLLIANGTGAGTYNLSGGTVTTVASATRGVILGVNTGTSGNFNLSGTGSLQMTTGGNSILQIGRSDSAANNTTNLFNQTGGTASIGILAIGGNAATGTGINSTLSLTGGTFTASTFTLLAAGDTNIAVINIGGTADVTLPDFPTIRGTSSTATINFDGGTLKNSAVGGTLITTATTAYIKAGGAKFDTTAGSTTISADLLTHGSSLGGGLTKIGINTLTLTGANTYTGGTTLNQGTITIGTGGTLGTTTGLLSVNNSNSTAAGTNAILNLATAVDTTTGSLSGTIATPLSGTNTATINNGGVGRNFTVNQTSVGTYAGVIAGAGSFTLGGLSTNTLTLTGTNTYTGATNVTAGTLAVNGTGTINNSAVTINGGTFRYNSSTAYSGALTFTSGTIGGTNLAGSLDNLTMGTNQTLSPGNSPGTSATGSQTWAGGGSYNWEINNATGTAGMDPGWDLLSATGTLTITATSGSQFNLNLISLLTTPVDTQGALTNFDNSLNYNWLIADFANTVVDYAANAFNINTTNFINNNTINGTFAVVLGDTIGGGDNTQLYLTYTAIPEPKAALLGCLGMLLLLRRRR